MTAPGTFPQSLAATYALTMPPQIVMLFLYCDGIAWIAFPVYIIMVGIVITPMNLLAAFLNTKFLKFYPSRHAYTAFLVAYSLFAAFVAYVFYSILAAL